MKARLAGINHVALEVGDIDEALEFYAGMGLDDLEKSPRALDELRDKGMAPPE